MSKPQTWIVAAVVGLAAIIVVVKHFGGSAGDDETAAPQRLAQQKATAEHGGWSVRSNSEDIATSDDVKVQRRADAKLGNLAPARPARPPESQGGKPAPDAGEAAPPAESDNGTAAADNQGTPGAARPGAVAGAQAARSDNLNAQGEPAIANAGHAANAPVAGQVGAAGAPAASGEAPGGSTGGAEQKPPQEQAAQPTPGAANPEVIAVGAIYDSKDTTFAIDNPTELKDIGNISGHGVTMMMNLAPTWAPDNQDDADLLKLGDNLALTKNVNFLRLEYTDANGAQHSIGTDMTGPAWQGIEQPYSMAATIVDNQMALVVNGKLVAHGVWDGQPYEAPTNPTLGVGCLNFPASRPCAAGDATGVMVLPPMSNADSIAHTKPPNAK